MCRLTLLVAFFLAHTEGLISQSNTTPLTSRVTNLPPDYTESLTPKKFLKKYRIDRRMMLDSDGDDAVKVGTESLEDSFDHQMFRRRSKDDSWNWDTYCQLQPQHGTNCEKPQKKYYYDRQLDSCLPFQYTGCKKNKNNFNNLWECDGYCKGAAYSDVVPKDADASIICALQPDAGRCLAYFVSYYFDINSGTCKKFGYGGCGGNKNQFRSRLGCNKFCKHSLREAIEDDVDSVDTDLSSDDGPENKEESDPTPNAVKRAKQKNHGGNKSGLDKSNKIVRDISKSNEDFIEKIKNGISKQNTLKYNNKVDNAQNSEEGSDKGDNVKEILDPITNESEATKISSENHGDSMKVITFSTAQADLEKDNENEAANALSGSDEDLDILTGRGAEKNPHPDHDGDSKLVFSFSNSAENLSIQPSLNDSSSTDLYTDIEL